MFLSKILCRYTLLLHNDRYLKIVQYIFIFLFIILRYQLKKILFFFLYI